MESNFSFLQDKFPTLAKFGKQAESYVNSDPNSALMKLGIMGETFVNLMITLDGVEAPEDSNAASRINLLRREGLIENSLSNALHALRQIRNKAVHENYDSVDDSKRYLQLVYSISVWFMQAYGDWDFKPKPFVMPGSNPGKKKTVAEKKAEEKKDEQIAKELVKDTPQDKSITKTERIKHSALAANQRPLSEAETRIIIDQQLRDAGWEADTTNLNYKKGVRPQKGRNLAIAEWQTDSTVSIFGYADYALFAGEKLVGIVEAKAQHKNVYAVLDGQCKDYARGIKKEDDKYLINTWGDYKVPFVFAANGRPYLKQFELDSGIWFQDLRNTKIAPRALQGFCSPQGLKEMLDADINNSNKKLEDLSFNFLQDKNGLNLRKYQIEAIQAIEQAIVEGKQTALLAMATGTGKTRTVLGLLYRLLKTDRFRRILFLVDRKALGYQALDTFKDVKLEDLQTLDQIYAVKELGDKTIENDTKVHIATVQGMIKRIQNGETDRMPTVSDYDLVIVDEAHRGYISDREMAEAEAYFRDQSDYQSKYRKVIEYFDAVKVALTATPTINTTEIFGKPVYNYTYRQAVIDGYLVDYDAPHQIKTKLSQEGIHYKKGDTVAVLDPITHEVTNSELLEDELDFEVDQFNKKSIN
ncbi:MAG: DEAD/DEAH box helicase family protein, partial [Erysipelotrichaceae bacterium]|nr:DEAD/DEAH box helicase family protein [Erysipelotrichaceae bacterium]